MVRTTYRTIAAKYNVKLTDIQVVRLRKSKVSMREFKKYFRQWVKWSVSE